MCVPGKGGWCVKCALIVQWRLWLVGLVFFHQAWCSAIRFVASHNEAETNYEVPPRFQKVISPKHVLVLDFNQNREIRTSDLNIHEILIGEPDNSLGEVHGPRCSRREHEWWGRWHGDCPATQRERNVYRKPICPRLSVILDNNLDYRSRSDMGFVRVGDGSNRYVGSLSDFNLGFGLWWWTLKSG